MTDEDIRHLAWSAPTSPATVDFNALPHEPRNPAAESATLGALMLSKRCADALLPVLRTEHFTSQPHQETLEAIRAVQLSGRPVDPLLVHDQLRRQGRLAWGNIKAATFVHACMEATYFPGHGESYASAVIECAARRRVLQAGIRIAQAAAHGTGELPELMRLVATELHGVADEATAHDQVARSRSRLVPLGDAVEEVRQKVELNRRTQDAPHQLSV
jgi:replicative DNA helicase